MKKVLFGIGICMFCLVMLAINVYAMPEPTIVNIGRWVLVESSEKGYEPYILDEHNLNTKICGLSDTAKDLKELKESNVKVSDQPSSLISSKTADKELVDGKAGYCYETKGETYIKLFDNSIIYEWENETWYVYDTDIYDKGGFYIEAWDGSGKILTPFIHWIEVADTSKFFFNLTNYSFPIENLTLRVWNYDKGLQFTSGVIEQEYSCVYYPYKTECEPRLQLNINDMLTAEENNITSANVTETHYSESVRGINHCTWNSEGWNDFLDCMRTPEYFDIEIIGTINNTDPELDLVYLSTSPLGWHNRTEFTTLGARLHAPVLFMDFNKPNETGYYVQDNSIYNNYGTYSFIGSELVTNGNMELDGEWYSQNSPTINVRSSTQKHAGSYSRKFTSDSAYDGIRSNSALTTVTGSAYLVDFWVYPDDQTYLTWGISKGDGTLWEHSETTTGLTQDAWNHITYIEPSMSVGGSSTKIYFISGASDYVGSWYIDDASIKEYNNLYTASGGYDGSGAYEFDGTTDYIRVNSSNSLDSIGNQATYRVWLNPSLSSTSKVFGVFQLYKSDTDRFFIRHIDNSGLYLNYFPYNDIDDTGDSYTLTPTCVRLYYGNWYDLVYTFDGLNHSIYVNGTYCTSQALDTPIGNLDDGYHIGIGEDNSTANRYWNGSIDQVQIWDRALSAEEVLELYNGTTYNNSNHTGKYSRAGDFNSLVYYNDSSTYWNVTMSLADSISDVAIGGDITYADGYIIHTFTTNDTFTVIDGSVNFETLILAGGGGGGFGDSGNVVSYNGGGGGAGGMILYNFSSLSSGTYNVIVGTGGSGGIGSTTTASISGTNSSFNGQNAKGGGRGGEGSGSSYGAAGGSGGGQGGYSSSGGGGAGLTGQGNDGGDTGGSPAYASGGGGGKVSAGVNGAKYGGGGTGGTGLTINFNGTSVTYASGGYGGSSGSAINGTNGADGRGIGGGGGRTNSGLDDVNGGDGGDGIVIIRYLDPSPNSSVYDLCKVDNSCVSYWDLDSGNSDANPFNDEKGSNDGTPTGTNNATGISSGAMRFDGVDDKIDISNSINDISSDQQGTISMWIDFTSYTGTNNGYNIMSFSKGDTTNYFQINTNDNRLRFAITNGTLTTKTTSTKYQDGWHHLLITSNGTNTSIYVDGIMPPLDQDTADAGNWFGDLTGLTYGRIGGLRYNGVDYVYNGYLDEVLIYNKSLTASEVSQLYKAGLSQHANANVTLQTRVASGYNVSDSELMLLWSFNNDNSTNAIDETGKYNGTRQGAIADATEGNGTVGKGYYFDGNDYINLDLQPFGKDLQTVSLWFKTDTTATTQGIYSIEGSVSDNSPHIFVQVYSGTLREYVRVPGYRTLTSINANEWHHLAVSSNDTYHKFYVDGSFILENEIDTVNGAENYYIGTSFGGYFLGSIDEVRIYNRSLSAAEIQNLYELGNYHIEWNDWQDEGKVNDSNPDISSSSGNFFQIKPIFETDDTDVSAYLLNHSIEASYYVDDTFPPGIIVLSPTNTSYNYSSIYFNATANESIDTWIINYNGTNKTVTINTTSEVEDGVHHLFFYGNDSANNTGINDSIYFTVDTTPPAFDETPPNISILDNHEGNILNLNASDAIEFDCFSLNNSDFSIDCTGIITNTTALSAGNISLNVTINDTVNNTNSAVFNIEVNQSIIDENAPTWSNNKTNLTAYTLKGEEIYFNITLSDDNPDSFIFSWYNGSQWINDSAVAYSDSEEVEVVKTLNIAVGYINWTWYMNDTLGQSNQSDFWSIYLQPIPVVTIISPENTTYTVEQTELTFSVANTSELDVCWYNTGEANSTPIPLQNFTGLSSSEGENIWTVYCNNTENNIGEDTIVFSYNLPPSIDSTTLTPYIDYITASCSASDSDGIANYTLTINGTDETSGNISVCSYTFTSLTPGTYYQVIFEVYDNLDYRTETTDTATTLLTARRNVIPEGNIDLKDVYSIINIYNFTMVSANGSKFACRVNNTGGIECS